MKTRELTHIEVLPAAPEKVFSLLLTPSAIRSWWSAARAIVLPEAGGIWAAAWGDKEDDPDYITAATIDIYDPPERMVLTDYRYHVRSGPLTFDADFTTGFLITPHPQGAQLRITQAGFPAAAEADEFFQACCQGWSDTCQGMRRFLEDG